MANIIITATMTSTATLAKFVKATPANLLAQHHTPATKPITATAITKPPITSAPEMDPQLISLRK